LRTSNDAAVSIVPPKIPYGGFSPVRLQGWRIRQDLPGTSISLSLLPAYTDLRSVCRRPSCFNVDPPKVGSVDAMYCTAMRWNAPPTPGVLAPVRVMLPDPSSLNRPHPPHSRAHRNFTSSAYMRCLSCAGAPRPPASGSGLLLLFRPDMPSPTTPGSSNVDKFQSSNVDIAFAERSAARHSQHPRNPFHAGEPLRGFHSSHTCYGLPVCSPPCTDPTSFPAVGDFYVQAFNAIGTLLDMTTAVAGPLCWWDSHPLE